MINIEGAGIVLLFLYPFFCVIFYRLGSKDALRASKGIEPKGPIRAVKDIIENRHIEKEAKKDADERDAFEAVDGYTDEERLMIKKNSGE